MCHSFYSNIKQKKEREKKKNTACQGKWKRVSSPLCGWRSNDLLFTGKIFLLLRVAGASKSLMWTPVLLDFTVLTQYHSKVFHHKDRMKAGRNVHNDNEQIPKWFNSSYSEKWSFIICLYGGLYFFYKLQPQPWDILDVGLAVWVILISSLRDGFLQHCPVMSGSCITLTWLHLR